MNVTRRTALAAMAAGMLDLCVTACGGSGSDSGSGSGSATYTATYDITADYMTEDPDTGALSVSAYPSTPLGEDGAAVAYAGSFGSFVDAVSATATLEVSDDAYTYTFATQCGTEDNAIGYYAPEFTWSGAVEEQTDSSITVAAPTAASVTIHAGGQFATNEEQVGYFGEDGYTATESTTDCPYGNVPAGDALLAMFSAGTFEVSGSELGDFIAG